MKSSSLQSAPDRTPSPLDIPQRSKNTTVFQSAPPKHRISSIVFVCLAAAFVCALVFGAYYVGKNGVSLQSAIGVPKQELQSATGSSPTRAPSAKPMFSGTLTRLTQNLMIFKTLEDDTLNGIANDFVYYSAGQFVRGDLEGYTRVIAIRPSIGPGGPVSYVLATKDYQTYVLDDPDHHATRPEDDWLSPYMFLDKKKVPTASTFETEQPAIMSLDANYSLFREEIPTASVQLNKKDGNGNIMYDTPLVTDFSKYQTLMSPIPSVSFFVKPYEFYRNMNELDANEKQKEVLRQTYFMGDTQVIAVDSVGLPVTYALTTPEAARSYPAKKASYDAAVISYNAEVKKLQGQEDGTQYPKYPDYVYLPHLSFKSTEIQKSKDTIFFQNYDQAIPGACATQLNTRVIKVTESDLEKIGTFQQMPVFRLKDTKHPLYSLAFKNKLDYYDTEGSGWEEIHKGIQKPTLEEYIARNPLLFIEDYWHRWVALGEYDIQLPGGCGKPVIYLYPTKDTDVSVTFDAPVQLTTDIPSYAGSWNVRAQTNGTLTNLKPEFTRCDALPRHAGAEYAKEACETNTYPYLYWAGNVRSGEYPQITEGSIVVNQDLSGFLEKSLNAMGLNATEKHDFLEYWLPEMQKSHAPYYRVSFLTTKDVNKLFPLSVTPMPDTVFRMFMDYMPLTEMPAVMPKAQQLQKFVRNGFTLVEWGGRKLSP